MESKENKPQKKFRAGGVCATVWSNHAVGKDGQPRVFPSVSFEKAYKDKEGAWKTTNSLSQDDLPRAILVLQKAHEFLALRASDSVAEASS